MEGAQSDRDAAAGSTTVKKPIFKWNVNARDFVSERTIFEINDVGDSANFRGEKKALNPQAEIFVPNVNNTVTPNYSYAVPHFNSADLQTPPFAPDFPYGNYHAISYHPPVSFDERSRATFGYPFNLPPRIPPNGFLGVPNPGLQDGFKERATAFAQLPNNLPVEPSNNHRFYARKTNQENVKGNHPFYSNEFPSPIMEASPTLQGQSHVSVDPRVTQRPPHASLSMPPYMDRVVSTHPPVHSMVPPSPPNHNSAHRYGIMSSGPYSGFDMNSASHSPSVTFLPQSAVLSPYLPPTLPASTMMAVMTPGKRYSPVMCSSGKGDRRTSMEGSPSQSHYYYENDGLPPLTALPARASPANVGRALPPPVYGFNEKADAKEFPVGIGSSFATPAQSPNPLHGMNKAGKKMKKGITQNGVGNGNPIVEECMDGDTSAAGRAVEISNSGSGLSSTSTSATSSVPTAASAVRQLGPAVSASKKTAGFYRKKDSFAPLAADNTGDALVVSASSSTSCLPAASPSMNITKGTGIINEKGFPGRRRAKANALPEFIPKGFHAKDGVKGGSREKVFYGSQPGRIRGSNGAQGTNNRVSTFSASNRDKNTREKVEQFPTKHHFPSLITESNAPTSKLPSVESSKSLSPSIPLSMPSSTWADRVKAHIPKSGLTNASPPSGGPTRLSESVASSPNQEPWKSTSDTRFSSPLDARKHEEIPETKLSPLSSEDFTPEMVLPPVASVYSGESEDVTAGETSASSESVLTLPVLDAAASKFLSVDGSITSGGFEETSSTASARRVPAVSEAAIPHFAWRGVPRSVYSAHPAGIPSRASSETTSAVSNNVKRSSDDTAKLSPVVLPPDSAADSQKYDRSVFTGVSSIQNAVKASSVDSMDVTSSLSTNFTLPAVTPSKKETFSEKLQKISFSQRVKAPALEMKAVPTPFAVVTQSVATITTNASLSLPKKPGISVEVDITPESVPSTSIFKTTKMSAVTSSEAQHSSVISASSETASEEPASSLSSLSTKPILTSDAIPTSTSSTGASDCFFTSSTPDVTITPGSTLSVSTTLAGLNGNSFASGSTTATAHFISPATTMNASSPSTTAPASFLPSYTSVSFVTSNSADISSSPMNASIIPSSTAPPLLTGTFSSPTSTLTPLPTESSSLPTGISSTLPTESSSLPTGISSTLPTETPSSFPVSAPSPVLTNASSPFSANMPSLASTDPSLPPPPLTNPSSPPPTPSPTSSPTPPTAAAPSLSEPSPPTATANPLTATFLTEQSSVDFEEQKYSVTWLIAFGYRYKELDGSRRKNENVLCFILKSKGGEATTLPTQEGGGVSRRSHAFAAGAEEEKRLRGLPIHVGATTASAFPTVSLSSSALSTSLGNDLLPPLSRLPPQVASRGLLSGNNSTTTGLAGSTGSSGLTPLPPRRDYRSGGAASSNLPATSRIPSSATFSRNVMGSGPLASTPLLNKGSFSVALPLQDESSVQEDWRSRRSGSGLNAATSHHPDATAEDDRFAEAFEQWRHTTPEEETRIKPSENSWSERQKQQKGDEIAMKLRRFRSVLNKLTFEKFDSLYAQLLALRVSTMEEVDGLMRMIFELAVSQHHFITMYSNLCLKLHEDLPLFDDDKYFKRTLVTHCNHAFDENLKPMQRDDSLSSQETFEKEVLYKKRMNGLVKFVGELLIRKLVSSKIIFECIDALLEGRQLCVKNSNGKDQGVHHLEALSAFLNAIGNQFTSTQFSRHAQIVDRFSAIKILLENKDIPQRERLLLKNVIEDYENGWIRKVAASQKGPMKLSDVQRIMKAENEQTLPNLTRAHSSTAMYHSHDSHHFSGFSSSNHDIGSAHNNKNLSPLLKQASFDSLHNSAASLHQGVSSFFYPSIKRSFSPVFTETAKSFLKSMETIADEIHAEEDMHSAITRIEGINIPKEYHGQIWWRLSVNICKTFCESKSIALLSRWLVLLLEKQIFDSLMCQKEFLRYTSEDKSAKASSIGYQRNCVEIKGYSDNLKILLELLHKSTNLPEEWQTPPVQNILKKLLS